LLQPPHWVRDQGVPVKALVLLAVLNFAVELRDLRDLQQTTNESYYIARNYISVVRHGWVMKAEAIHNIYN